MEKERNEGDAQGRLGQGCIRGWGTVHRTPFVLSGSLDRAIFSQIQVTAEHYGLVLSVGWSTFCRQQVFRSGSRGISGNSWISGQSSLNIPARPPGARSCRPSAYMCVCVPSFSKMRDFAILLFYFSLSLPLFSDDRAKVDLRIVGSYRYFYRSTDRASLTRCLENCCLKTGFVWMKAGFERMLKYISEVVSNVTWKRNFPLFEEF